MANRWGNYAITRVSYNYVESKKIYAVEVRACNADDTLEEALTWSRQKVVELIKRPNNQKFVTAPRVPGKPNHFSLGDEIIVISVKGVEYIRTDGNQTPEDNLGSLPQF